MTQSEIRNQQGAIHELRVVDLGRMAYAPALEIQRRTNEAVAAGSEPNTLILVEHEPVITVSQRRTAPEHLVATPGQLSAMGIEVQPTDRGGDITYHGPGQIVAYPILQLTPLGLNLSRYMRLLEQVVIETLAAFGIEGVREAGNTGVWVRRQKGLAKICAMGVRIRRNTTMHGLALNVTTDLTHFQTIVPCGLARPVTSMAELMGEKTPTIAEVKGELVGVLRKKVG